MRFYADLHIHSKYSRATSRNCDLENLAFWARRKGITVVATGDFTHPAWFEELGEKLVPAEPGLFRLKDEVQREVDRRLPRTCRGPVRFLLEVEISTIYKKGEKTRKVHHLLYAPDFAAAGRIRDALGRIGNIASDGRPILGLDSRDLLEITLESDPASYLVPAHIWTPWFAAMGSKSGFDSIEDCYGDLAEHIFAVETGLSSDPPMNWRVSSLDRFTLVSNSDAHSPPMLGREACVFDTELDYFAIRRALESGQGYGGTVEFFPEEGKYHLDGHRACGVRLEPNETRRLEGACPSCGKPLTVGVMHRVETLADRPEGEKPERISPFRSLVPLPEIVSEISGVGPKSKTVQRKVGELVTRLGPELDILEGFAPEDVEKAAGDPLLREAIERLRAGEVRCEGGFDGEYGVVKVFGEGELEARRAMVSLFSPEDFGFGLPPEPVATSPAPGLIDPLPEDPPSGVSGARLLGGREDEVAEAGADGVSAEGTAVEGTAAEGGMAGGVNDGPAPLLSALDPDQRSAAQITEGPLMVIAGPGTGKTRTLTHRLAHLVASGVPAEQCLALTFTRRAAEEMDERLATLLPRPSGLGKRRQPLVTTFHGLGLRLIRQHHRELHLGPKVAPLGRGERRQLARDLGLSATGTGDSSVDRWLEAVARRRRAIMLEELHAMSGARPSEAGTPPSDAIELRHVEAYEKALRAAGRVDFDDLLILPLRLFIQSPDLLEKTRRRYRHLSIDEYQDIDALQYQLVRQLAGLVNDTDDDAAGGRSLCAIGDPDQSIYRFRGAEVAFFLRFQDDFPGTRTVQLWRNYRSTPVIVEAARAAIAPASLVSERRLEAVANRERLPLVVHTATSEAAEAEFVAHGIEALLGGTSYFSVDSGRVASGVSRDSLAFDDIAVLYRADHQAGALIEALERAGIPYQKRSHDRLSDRPGVRRVLVALEADTTAEAAALPLVERIGEATEKALTETPDELRGAVIEARELLGALAATHSGDRRLDRLLAAARTANEIDTWDPRAQRVSLLTLHAAKGLEFPVVFLVGCADGQLPFHFGDGLSAEEEAEERRLFFVGLTRARRRLFLSWARRRHRRGQNLEGRPSPFLDALPEGLVVHRSAPAPRKTKTRLPRQLKLL